MFTDEMMQELHDDHFALMGVEEFDPDTITESDMFDCVHEDSKVTEYADKAGVFFQVWECNNCGHVGQMGMES